MEILSSALPSNLFNFSFLSFKSKNRLISERNRHRLSLPISKFPPILRVSARFGETSRRRNSLRKKLIGDGNLWSNSKSLDPGTKPRNTSNDFNQNDDLVEFSRSEVLKDRVSNDSNLLNELEDWVSRYKKEVEYWGIGSNPIFRVYQNSNGKVEKVEVDEDEILRRRLGIEDLETVNSKVQYAKNLAAKMENGENVIHKDSSLVKIDSSYSQEEEEFISSIQNTIRRLDLVPKLPVIGGVVLCSYIGFWLLKKLLMFKSGNEVECTELEKEMMRRKMEAWKRKERLKKGTVEVLEKPLMKSFEKPLMDQEKLVKNIAKVKGLKNNLESSQVQRVGSVEFDEKINEIREMARRAREIEAGVEINEEKKGNFDKEMDEEDDKDESSQILTDNDHENIELSASDTPMEEETNGFPRTPTDRIIQSSDVSMDEFNSTGRRSRVIRSVKEAKEFLSRKTGGIELSQEPSQKRDQNGVAVNGALKSALQSTSSEISGEDIEFISQKKDDQKFTKPENAIKGLETSLCEAAESSSTDTEHLEKEQPSGTENWIEKHYDEFEPVVEKMRAGFRDNYMAAREKETQQPGTIAEIAELYRSEDSDELEWMKDEKLRDIVFRVRDNELAGRDPFHLIEIEDKTMFLQGLEMKVEKENEKLSHLHQWIHSNIENLDYGVDGISVYDSPEKVIPRWKGPPMEKNPEFLDNFQEQRAALFSGKAESTSPVKKEEQSSLLETSQSTSSENSLTSAPEISSKIVVEGSDGSVKPGKKSGKEYWEHTKKWSRGFLELYNAETDPEVKAVMKDMGKDLDRWITEEEIKEAGDLMEKLPEKNKKFMEKKLNKLKREMELFGPQAVVSKYSEYGKEKEEDYLWWLDLPHILCLEMYTVEKEGEERVGFYSLEMATDLEIEPKPHHVIAFENAADCRNLCYIIQAHLDMLGTGNVFIVPRPPKEAFREAKGNGFGVTVIRKGELKLNIDEPLEEVEEKICEIGSKMYHDKIMADRSVDISSLMKGVFNLKTKPTGRRKRMKHGLRNPEKKSS